MTLVASLYVYEFPVVFGDLLVSNRRRYARPTTLPTRGQMPEIHPPDEPLVLSGLSQKIEVIGGDCMFAFAGNSYGATRAVERLHHEIDTHGYSMDGVQHAVEEIAGKYPDISLVGFLSDKDRYAQIDVRGLEYVHPKLGRICAAGSGCTGKGRWFEQTTGALGLPDPSQDATENAGRAIGAANVIGASMLVNELGSLETLLENFGGGYELAFPIDGRFQKMDEVTTIVWIGRRENDRWTFMLRPALLVKHQYCNDFLIVRSARHPQPQEETGGNLLIETVAVPPILATKTKPDISSVQGMPLHSLRTTHVVGVEIGDRMYYSGIFEKVASEDAISVHINIAPGGVQLQLAFGNGFIAKLQQELDKLVTGPAVTAALAKQC